MYFRKRLKDSKGLKKAIGQKGSSVYLATRHTSANPPHFLADGGLLSTRY